MSFWFGCLLRRAPSFTPSGNAREHEVCIAGKPELLFDGPYQFDDTGHPSYDVTADGQRFVMIRSEATGFDQISITLNWSERVKKLVPRGS